MVILAPIIPDRDFALNKTNRNRIKGIIDKIPQLRRLPP